MVRDHKWTLTAAAVIGGALLLTRGGLASIVPLIRPLLVIGVIAFSYRVVKAKVLASLGRTPSRGGRQDTPSEVIDLCPKCGSYLRPGHRCQG